jgi:hypothetical protein
VFDELFKNSVEQSKIGFRAPTLRRTFNFRVPHQWNGRCDKYLKVIGDKHGPAATKGLSTSHGLAYLDAMERHLHVRVRILHVIRHPLDNIATITVRQSHKRTFIEEGKLLNDLSELKKRIRVYFWLVSVNYKLLRQQKYSILNIHSEDLIAKPKEVLSKICRFLKLDCSPSYIADCTSIISNQTSQTRKNVVWGNLKKDVYKNMLRFPFLQRYRQGLNTV